MGRLPRQRPKKLPVKLLQVREALDLTQEQMLVALKLDKKLFASAVSGYELGTREPPLPVLLRYARLAGVVMDVLVDDDVDLDLRLARSRDKEFVSEPH